MAELEADAFAKATDHIVERMTAYASACIAEGKLPKRENALRACMDEMTCTYRVALGAWKSLPSVIKRKPRCATPSSAKACRSATSI